MEIGIIFINAKTLLLAMSKKRMVVGRGRFIPTDFCPCWSNRGQVTVFIILGLILLLVLALLLLFKEEIVKFKPQEIDVTDKGKIEQFITSCITSVGEEAVSRVGLQGGYVNVPPEFAGDENLHVRTSPFTVIPYWAYGSAVYTPSLEMIQSEINSYIETNVRDCLFDLEPFQETYSITEKSPITAHTEAVQNQVVFNVHWDLEIKNKAGEVVTELVDHTAQSSIKLKRVYDTAAAIVDTEMRDLKLEDITQDLIALEHPNLPVAGMEFSCSEKSWKIKDVRGTLQSLLRINLPELRIAGTEVVEFPEGLPYYQNHYLWNLGEEFSQPQVSVQFAYDNNYPFTFDVAPRSGSVIKSNQLGGSTGPVPFPCVQTWKFVYDITFPVVVTVRDETTGYIFQLAFTVHVHRNLPDRSEVYVPRKISAFTSFSDDDFCKERTIPMTVSTYELIENEQTGVSDQEPLDNTEISFACLRYGCSIGNTEYNYQSQGDVASLTTNFPYCAGAIIRGSKPNYKEDWQRVVTTAGQNVELNLVPLFSFPLNRIKILKHQVTAQQQLTTGQELSPSETVLLKLTYRKSDSPPNQPFHEDNIVYSRALDQVIVDQEQFNFLAKTDFTYQLEINILDDDNFVGGYTGNWTVPWDQLAGAQGITFHVVSQAGASNEEQFSLLSSLPEQSKLLPAPEFN